VIRPGLDGVGAVFEAPMPALLAARDLLAAGAAREGGDPSPQWLPVGLAVHAGSARRVGTDWVGPATHECARLARLAVGLGSDGALVSGTVVSHLSDDELPSGVDLVELGERDVPGAGRLHLHRLRRPESAASGAGDEPALGSTRASPLQRIPAAVGRGDVHAVLRDLVTQPPDGGRVVLVQGEAGIGKTVLWRDALVSAQLHGIRVWRAVASPPGSQRPFGVLADLLADVAEDDLASLPDLQRQALEVVLHRRPSEEATADWVVVATSLRRLAASLAETAPLLVAVDDLPWVDEDSTRVLAHVLRRSDRVGACLLATERTGVGEPTAGWVRDLLLPTSRIVVDPMDDDGLVDVVRAAGLASDRPDASLRRVVERADGNPLLALELVRARTDGDDVGLERDERIRGLVARRLDGVSASTRDVLALMALDTTGSVDVLVRAVGASGGLAEALDEAESAGLAVPDAGRIRFAHPLHGHAVRSLLDAPARRIVHRRLAGVVHDELGRAHHLARATTLPDPEVAGELTQAAQTAQASGAGSEAANLAQRAFELTPSDDPDAAAERGLIAVAAALDITEEARARAMLERLAGLDLSVDARARLELARLRWFVMEVEDYEQTTTWLLAQDGLAPDTRLRATLMRASGKLLGGDLSGCAHIGREALALVGDSNDHLLRAQVLGELGQVEDLLGLPIGRDRLREAWRLAGDAQTSPGPVGTYDAPRTALGLSSLYRDDVPAAREHLEAQLVLARDRGQDPSIVSLSLHLVEVEVRAGRLDVADEHLATMDATATDEDAQVSPGLQYAHALVATLRGDEATTISHARRGLVAARDSGQDLWALGNAWALGHLALSRGEARAADRHLAPLAELGRRLEMAPVVHRVAADVAEAAVAVGDLDRAQRLIEELEAVASSSPGNWTAVVAARARARLALARDDVDRADTAIGEALAAAGDLPDPHERARVDLVAGALRRRQGHRAMARDHLERAVAVFDDMGAESWAERARAEEARISGRPRNDDSGLTETEQQVAELAASGLTNREIATRMFVSHKTVEHNLTRVYRKLGIRSRTELAARGIATG